jgi:hypothetical protein
MAQAALKRMPRLAFRQRSNTVVLQQGGINAYGKHWGQHFPTASAIFAFDSIELETLAESLEDLWRETEPAHRVDAILCSIAVWCTGRPKADPLCAPSRHPSSWSAGSLTSPRSCRA